MEFNVIILSVVCAFASEFVVAEDVAHNKINNGRNDHFLHFRYSNTAYVPGQTLGTCPGIRS